VVTTSFPNLGNYPVTLTVKDSAAPQASASTTISVNVNIPPIAPTANAGGPYVFCPNATPWFLNGTASANPDNGLHEPGPYPGDSITSYAWELSGNNAFDDASGVSPNVTSFFTTAGAGNYLISLKVTDNSALSYPSSGTPAVNLTNTAST
jgi:hypothetical protein